MKNIDYLQLIKIVLLCGVLCILVPIGAVVGAIVVPLYLYSNLKSKPNKEYSGKDTTGVDLSEYIKSNK